MTNYIASFICFDAAKVLLQQGFIRMPDHRGRHILQPGKKLTRALIHSSYNHPPHSITAGIVLWQRNHRKEVRLDVVKRPPPPPWEPACGKECCEAAFTANICDALLFGWNEVEAM